MQEIRAELSGSVWKVLVSVGDSVERDQEIMILESMKMEIPVVAPAAGTIGSIEVAEGVAVETGDLLAKVALP